MLLARPRHHAPTLMHRALLQKMFYGVDSLNQDLSEWDTSSVTDMSVRANDITYTPHSPYPQHM